jgi:starch synthase (maltosyl-transferring)
MMPIGFEYGFRRRLDVVKTTPRDWETPHWDLCDYITTVNRLKAARRVFKEEGPIEPLAVGNPHIVALVKSTWDKAESAILILNKDLRHTQFCDLGPVAQRVTGVRHVHEVSPDGTLVMVPHSLGAQIKPAVVHVLYAS